MRPLCVLAAVLLLCASVVHSALPTETLSTRIIVPNTNESQFNTTQYATKDQVAVLTYYLSVLQVVVILNSVLIGVALLLVGTLTAIKCMEDTNHDPTEIRMEDPLWLKGFSMCNSLVELALCQFIKPLRPKGKPIHMFNVPKWRSWHKHDLDLQRGIIEEEVHEEPVEEEAKK